jgi:hypothetical protein
MTAEKMNTDVRSVSRDGQDIATFVRETIA